MNWADSPAAALLESARFDWMGDKPRRQVAPASPNSIQTDAASVPSQAMTDIDIYVLLLFLSGAALLYRGKRRAYLRMNSQGRGPVPGYASMLAARLIDGLLVFTGCSMLASAALFLAAEYAGQWLALAIILYVAFLLEREWYERRR